MYIQLILAFIALCVGVGIGYAWGYRVREKKANIQINEILNCFGSPSSNDKPSQGKSDY